MAWFNWFTQNSKSVRNRNKSNKAASQPLGYMLEPRMLFDGAIAATVATTSETTTADHTTADTPTHSADDQSTAAQNAVTDTSATENQTTATQKEVAFIDTSVNNYQTLVNEVSNNNPNIEVVLIDGSEDGLQQIADWASTHSGYDAIHIFSHGSEGTLNLGTSTISDTSLQSADIQAELATIGQALTSNGDLLLYGCDVAAGNDGQQFITDLASLTQADIAASTDATGPVTEGGNWVLERHTGDIDVQSITASQYTDFLATSAIFDFESNVEGLGTQTVTQQVSGETLTITSDTYNIIDSSTTSGADIDGSVTLSTDYDISGGLETKLTFSISGKIFDLSSLKIFSVNADNVFTLTSSLGTYSFTVLGGNTDTINVAASLSSAYFQGISSFTLTAADPYAIDFDTITLNNIQTIDSTSTVSFGASSEATTLATTSTSVASATSLLDLTISDAGTADSLATTISSFYANVSGTATSSELAKMSFLLNGPDATNVLGTYDSGTGRITFSGLNLSIADGDSETYTIKAYYSDNTSSNDLTDHHTVVLSVNASNFTTGSGSSTFAGSQANVTNGSGASIDIAATKLIYSQSPSTSVVSGVNLTSQPVVIAVDDRGNIDTDFNGSVTLSENGSGSLTGTTQVTASNGTATFSGVKYTSASDADANFVLTAAAGSVVSATSASINPDVVATKLVFSTQPVPTAIQDGQSTSFTTIPVVQAVDATGMVDQDYTTNIVLSVTDPNDGTVDGTVNSFTVTSGDQDASSTTVTLTPSGGIATYSGLVIMYTNSGSTNTLALRATSGSLTAVNSSSITATTNSAPVFSNLNGGATYTENGSAVVIDNDVTIADTELDALNSGLGNYNGASITVARNGGASSNDIFGNSGLLGTLTQGQNFTYNGTTVGSVTTNSGGTLTLTFNSNATSAIVDAVLQSLTYTNNSDDPPASVTLGWTFNDGSINSSGTNQAVLSITPVNDAPVISNTAISKTFNEDSAQTFTAADFGFSDVDSGDTLQSITIVTAPGAGELFIDVNGDGMRGVGDTLLGNGAVVSAGNIGKLTFRPAADANGAGYATVTWTVSDGTASSANVGTMPLNVTAVNDAPVISNTAVSKTFNEDSAQTFTAADFDFSDVDSGDTLQSITIVTAPAAGELFIDANGDGVRGVGDTLLGNGAVVSAANIGKLTFRPAANANGAGYAAFTWTDSDGTASSANTGTMTLNVTAVNDAPTLSNGTTVTLTSTTEDVTSSATTVSSLLSNAGYGDVDSGASSGIAITTTAGNGGWQYSTDSGANWFNIGTVSGSSALLLSSTAQVRYVPDSANGETATLAFKAWDQTSGSATAGASKGLADTSTTGGSSAFSNTSAQASMTITSINDAPTVGSSVSTQSATKDTAFSFTVPGGTFVDVDTGDTLTLHATQSDGSALPTWLSFNPSTSTFSGTPARSDVGNLSIRVTATDSNSATVSTTFSLTVNNSNLPPIVANPFAEQAVAQDGSFSFTVPTGTFTDPDAGEILTFSATLADGSALPTWLNFNPSTRTFSGTPANGDVGNIAIRVTATDSENASVSTTFELNVTNVNDAPVLSGMLNAQTATQNSNFSFTVPVNVFTDPDVGDTLTLHATQANGSALPSWLSFNPSTRTFSGTPGNGDEGSLSIRVTATDNFGSSVSTTFQITVEQSVTGADSEFKANDGAAGSLQGLTTATTQSQLILITSLPSQASNESWHHASLFPTTALSGTTPTAAAVFGSAYQGGGATIPSEIATMFHGYVPGSYTFGETSTLAGLFGSANVPGNTPLEVFSTGSWNQVMQSSALPSSSPTSVFGVPVFSQQLKELDSDAQQITALENALKNRTQLPV